MCVFNTHRNIFQLGKKILAADGIRGLIIVFATACRLPVSRYILIKPTLSNPVKIIIPSMPGQG
jgi:hypothetical protein